MATYATKKVITEFQEILKASKLKPIVTVNDLKPLAELTEDIQVDIALESIIYTLDRNTSGRNGYSRTALISLYIGANCIKDNLRIYDVVDELENDLLKDNELWQTVINRDIATVTYDHGMIGKYRAATILVEAVIRLECY